MNDTSDFFAAKQREIIFSKTPEERFMMGIEMCRAARKMVEAGIKRENKDLSEDEMSYFVFQRYYPELVESTAKAWQIYFALLKIEKSEDWEQIKIFQEDFLAQFPFEANNYEIEKSYNHLFVLLFKKIKNKNDWDFVKTEIYRLGLKMNDYTQSFYDNLSKKYQ